MEAKLTFSRSPNCVVSSLGEKPCALDPASSGGRGDCDPTKPCPLTWEVGERVLRVACKGQAGCVGACPPDRGPSQELVQSLRG